MCVLEEWVGELEGVIKLIFIGVEDVGGGFEIKLFSKNLYSL